MGNLVFYVFGWPAVYLFVDHGCFSYGHCSVRWSSIPEDFDYFVRYRDLLKAVLEFKNYA